VPNFKRVNNKPLHMQGFFLCCTIGIYLALSRPGLSGGFILDDWSNLTGLEQAKTPQGFWHYVFGGVSSTLGRPLSLLSYALQAQDWPGNPYPFKVAGLAIHIINTVLLYLACRQIGKLQGWPGFASAQFSAAVMLFWLFLPINISSVFYVVQRMTLLSALFSLIGLLGFLWGIGLKTRFGGIVATFALAIAYGLGILSKENAVLTGLQVAVLYAFLLRDRWGSKRWDAWIALVCVLPPALVLGYLSVNIERYTRAEFTPWQRMLSESVVLQDYLFKILLPTPGRLNIFNDGFPVYTSLGDSWLVLEANAFWVVLSAAALWWRKKYRFLAFGLFWFLAGHVLESSIFGLELYFEHRNYLPSAGLIIGLVGELFAWRMRCTKTGSDSYDRLTLAGLVVVAVFHLAVYGAEINSWRSPAIQAMSALVERPESIRAHQEAAAFFANSGDYANSALILNAIEKKWPGFPGTYSQLLMLGCVDDRVLLPDKAAFIARFKAGVFDRGTLDAWNQILNFKKQGACQNLSWRDFQVYTDAIVQNQNFAFQLEDWLAIKSFALDADGRLIEAAHCLDAIDEAVASLDFLLLKAKFYAVSGLAQQSLAILEGMRSRSAANLRQWLPIRAEVEKMTEQLRFKLGKQ